MFKAVSPAIPDIYTPCTNKSTLIGAASQTLLEFQGERQPASVTNKRLKLVNTSEERHTTTHQGVNIHWSQEQNV